MLRHLRIQSLALLDTVSIDFTGGVTAITGESGSGKSIFLQAFDLLAGKRANPSLVRRGDERATVEAVFDIDRSSPAALLLDSWGLLDDSEVIMRREVLASGRSRASINGRLVPLGQLDQLGSTLLDLNGQNDQQRLASRRMQRELYDEFAEATAARSTYETCYTVWQTALEQLSALRAAGQNREQRLEFLRFQISELAAAEVSMGERGELEAEAHRLRGLHALRDEASSAEAALNGGDDGRGGAIQAIALAVRHLGALAESEPRLQKVTSRLQESLALAEDVSFELGRFSQNLEADPDRILEIEDRLALIKKILRRFGPDEQAAIDRLAAMEAEILAIDSTESEVSNAEGRLKTARQLLKQSGHALTRLRSCRAKDFNAAIAGLLKDYALSGARLNVRLDEFAGGEPSPHGDEEVDFVFSANPGEPLMPLAKVASGGELSRVLLSLRTLYSGSEDQPLLIFDEIDAGISGSAARCVAERLASLGARSQILCVSHNPAMAAVANQHLVVEKVFSSDRATSLVRSIFGEERQRELARLLDGGTVSIKGLELAGELLARTG